MQFSVFHYIFYLLYLLEAHFVVSGRAALPTGYNNNSMVILAFITAVPGAPVEVVILDVGSESVRVEWSDSLPMDNGGAPIRNIRLSYKEVSAEEWTDEALEVDAGDMFTIISGLRDRRTYHIRMEIGNIIGSYTVQSPSVYLAS